MRLGDAQYRARQGKGKGKSKPGTAEGRSEEAEPRHSEMKRVITGCHLLLCAVTGDKRLNLLNLLVPVHC